MNHHLILWSRTALLNSHAKVLPCIRSLSTQEAIERRNHLFTLEKKRQHESIGRIEKIEVKYKGNPKDCTFVMNKGISTPHDCARHLSDWHVNSSAVALIDGLTLWDMHRPLTENCTLELQHFTIDEPQKVNKAFWRTCSFLLGASATAAFKESIPLLLHSFPGPDIRSGSFIYDIDLPSLSDWKPTPQEILTLSAEYMKLCRKNLPLERLDISESLASEMFTENHHKLKQIPSIAKNNGNVTVYRAGTHVDISRGPMVANSGLIGRISIAAVHKLTGSPESDVKQLYRFQGVALPVSIMINHFTYSILVDRAKKLNPSKSLITIETDSTSSEPQRIKAQA